MEHAYLFARLSNKRLCKPIGYVINIHDWTHESVLAAVCKQRASPVSGTLNARKRAFVDFNCYQLMAGATCARSRLGSRPENMLIF
eukprot:scaffold21789_cov22-Tisochrysis_lutea.AAC.4